jgi:AcrR family transcriptional regulator
MSLAEKRAQLKKEEILRSAIKIIRERGVDRATMEEIAAELLMTKGSLYYYFKNKEDIYYSCHQYVLQKTLQLQRSVMARYANASDALDEMIAIHLEAAIEERELFHLLEDPKETFAQTQLEEMLSLRKQYQSLFDEVLQRGVSEGVFRIEHLFITRMTILGALNWTQQWYRESGSLSKEEIQTQFKACIHKLLL